MKQKIIKIRHERKDRDPMLLLFVDFLQKKKSESRRVTNRKETGDDVVIGRAWGVGGILTKQDKYIRANDREDTYSVQSITINNLKFQACIIERSSEIITCSSCLLKKKEIKWH